MTFDVSIELLQPFPYSLVVYDLVWNTAIKKKKKNKKQLLYVLHLQK